MKRNIVILLCLVFFTQSAFTWFCNDCKRERKTCRRDLGNCRRNNGDCQDLHKNESARIEELETQKDTCLREKNSWRHPPKWGTFLITSVFAVGACYICWQWNKLKNQKKQIDEKDALIQSAKDYLVSMQHLVQD
jgi:hypothetical protein